MEFEVLRSTFEHSRETNEKNNNDTRTIITLSYKMEFQDHNG